MGPIGIFGGTFDPIHFGHLRAAQELADAARLETVHLVPCARPPHRQAPVASADLRAQMVEVAIRDNPRFVLDHRELLRDGPSYSVDTLESFRSEFGERPLCLLLGMDAFLSFFDWYRYESILNAAHLVVAHRPGWEPPTGGEIGSLLSERLRDDPADLRQVPAGLVFVRPVSQLDISSSGIRHLILNQGDPRYLLPDAVLSIMRKANCYAEH